MNSARGSEIVQRFYDAWEQGAVTELFFVTREEIDISCLPMAAAMPVPTRCRGRSQLASFYGSLCDAVRFSRFEIREMEGRGDVVVASGEATGFVPATGRSFQTGWTHVFTLRGGHISRLRVFFDRLAVMEAFGLEAPQTETHAA